MSFNVAVHWRLDRLGRSLSNAVQIVACLERQGIGFGSIKDQIGIRSAAGKLQFHVFTALAEFERNLIRACKQAAPNRRTSPWPLRRPETEAGRQADQTHLKTLLREPKTSVAELARDYGVSRMTIYKHCGVAPPSMSIRP